MADNAERVRKPKNRKGSDGRKLGKKDKLKYGEVEDKGGSVDRISVARSGLDLHRSKDKVKSENDREEISRPHSEPLFSLSHAELEEAGEVDEDAFAQLGGDPAKSLSEPFLQQISGKPQVWIKLRPSPYARDNFVHAMEDGKGVRFNPQCTEQFDYQGRPKITKCRERQGQTFVCDGVLGNSSQEEFYQIIANDLVERAMDGISGVILCVGPAISGKYFTLFGSLDKFQYRGILPRSLERVFQICAARRSEMRYLIRMAIVEVRNDKIRDLLTLGSYELNQFDRDVANGMIFQQIGAAEHGIGLLIRALTCQKEIPRECYAKPHTVVFLDIYGESHTDESQDPPVSTPRVIKSRITFAKTAAIPEREVLFPPPIGCSSYLDSYGCSPSRPNTAPPSSLINRTTCESSSRGRLTCAKSRSGPVAEAIRIRQDLGYLEQMCNRAAQYQKLTQYHEKLLKLGVNVPPMPSRTQHYRLSKLTYCLKEIVSGNSEIRILLHIRPEMRYKHVTLETVRFAEKVKCVPRTPAASPKSSVETKPIFNEEFTLADFLAKMPTEIDNLYVHVQPGTFKTLRDHAAAIIDNRLHTVGSNGEAHVKEMFDKFRSLWFSLVEGRAVVEKTSSVVIRTQSQDSKLDYGDLPGSVRSSKNSSINKKSETTESGVGASTGEAKVDEIQIESKKSSKMTKSKVKSNHSLAAERSKRRLDKKNKSPAASNITSVHSLSAASGGKINMDEFPDDFESEMTVPQAPLPSAVEVEEEEAVSNNEIKLPHNEIPTRDEALQDFVTTPGGGSLFERFQMTNQELKKMVQEHNSGIHETSAILSRLAARQMDLNLIEQERFINGSQYDSKGEILVTPQEKQVIQELQNLQQSHDDLVAKLGDIRQRLSAKKAEVDAAKAEMELAFQTHARDSYGVTYAETGQWEKILDGANSSAKDGYAEEDLERIRKYEVIKRLAKRQARLYLKAMLKRPMWIPY